MKNQTLEPTINEILKKVINPVKITKGIIFNKFSIEIETKEPIKYISILYAKESDRDADFNILDERVFDTLSFNPLLDNLT